MDAGVNTLLANGDELLCWQLGPEAAVAELETLVKKAVGDYTERWGPWLYTAKVPTAAQVGKCSHDGS